MCATAALPVWGTGRTLPGAPGAFLAPGLTTTAGYFGAGLGIVRTQAGIRHLANYSLVHQIFKNRGFKDAGWKLHRANF
jgi:hypothetical protein